MTARRYLVLAILLLASCDRAQQSRAGGGEERGGIPSAQAAADRGIACATGGKDVLEPVCTVDQVRGPQGLVLVLRAPDGGFRRLLVTNDGRGVIAADGAELAIVTPIDADWIRVSVGKDIYRLPATVRQAE